MGNVPKKWSRTAVVYHIYPRSFKDSNNDGIGDLPGITSKLDYLVDLGVGAIWLSPIFKSPMVDFGYDISDYCDIDPMFGTLSDFDELVTQAHKRNIKVIVDFVPNHTSDQHPWFVESRSSKDSPKRDWYLWADGKSAESPHPNPPHQGEGKTHHPLNNWLSVFGGSGWEWDEHSGQYYFHSFLKQQPDLNWRNPEVVQAMTDVLVFWLDKGVDGFRMDAIHHLVKDKKLRDDPYNPDFIPGQSDPYLALRHTYSQGQDETLKLINSFCNLLSQYEDKFIVTEVYAPPTGMERYFRACENGLHSPFNFNLIGLPWRADMYKEFVDHFEGMLKENDWPNYVLGNHDKPRVASRLGLERARSAALMLLTLRGMPFVYYGDELGMEDVEIPANLVQDPFEKNVPGFKLGRDPQRTPMQWDKEAYAGFSSVPSWLPVLPDYQQENVEVLGQEPHSILNLYKKLIYLRNSSETLRIGQYQSVSIDNQNVFSYKRVLGDESFVVAVNFTDVEQKVCFDFPKATLVLSTNLDLEEGREVDCSNFLLRPNEGYLLRT